MKKDNQTPISMPNKFTTAYDSKRDPYYGVEYDPYTKKQEDCRDRD